MSRFTQPSQSSRTSTSRRREAGNAYLVTVMVMIIVTLLGLSLGAVTQTEMLIGSRERNNQRVFYLAEGGLNLSLARFMVTSNQTAAHITIELPSAYDYSISAGFGSYSPNGVVRMAPIKSPAINYCQLCDAASPTEGQNGMQQVRLPVTIRASLESDSGQVLAQRRMSSLIDVTPWDGAVTDAGLDLQVDEIEFN